MRKFLTILITLVTVGFSYSQLNAPANFQVTIYHDKIQLSFVDNSTGEEEFQIRNRTNISIAPWSIFKNLGAQSGTSNNPRVINLTEFRDAESALKRFRIRAVKKNFFGLVSQSSDWVYYNPHFIIPNLVTSNVSFNVTNISPCVIGVSFDVRNSGNYVSKSCDATITVGSNEKIISIPALSPGEQRSFSAAINRDGSSIYNHRVIVEVDTSNDNYETTNSDNNAQSNPITVSPICGASSSIDLTIASPAIASQGVQSLNEKKSFSSSFVVYNLKSDLAPESTVKIYWNTSSSLSGAKLAKTITIPPVGANNNTGNRNFSVTTPDIPTNLGFLHYYLIFVADATNVITETNENNNRESYLFKINEVRSGEGIPIGPVEPLNLRLNDEGFSSSFEYDEEMLIYPNPSNNTVSIKLSGKEDQIVILNESGDIIKRIKTEKDQSKINLEGLKTGTYFIQSSSTLKTVRFIVK